MSGWINGNRDVGYMNTDRQQQGTPLADWALGLSKMETRFMELKKKWMSLYFKTRSNESEETSNLVLLYVVCHFTFYFV